MMNIIHRYKFFLMTVTLMLSLLASSRRSPAESRDYLDDIILYQRYLIEKNNITAADYLFLIKPYSIWDVRPQYISHVKQNENVTEARYVPDYVWGYLGVLTFNLPAEEIVSYPLQFIQQAHDSAMGYIADAKTGMKELTRLIDAVENSENKLFVNQDWLKDNAFNRVNNVYFQDGKYWRYVVPLDSPYPMSPRLKKLDDYSFSTHDHWVLQACRNAGIYAAVKRPDCIILLKGGMTANTCGYLWADTKPTNQMLGHLFHLCHLKHIESNLYYYVSN